jgi:hypothetical protein
MTPFQSSRLIPAVKPKRADQLHSSQKSHCQRLLKAGGMPSYVELLTCVEMKSTPTTPSRATTKKKGT